MLCWGVTLSLDSGAVWPLLVPEQVTSKHCSPSSPPLFGEMQLPLPRRRMGCPKVAQTHPLQSCGGARSPWPCCPPLLSAPAPVPSAGQIRAVQGRTCCRAAQQWLTPAPCPVQPAVAAVGCSLGAAWTPCLLGCPGSTLDLLRGRERGQEVAAAPHRGARSVGQG